jgi:hypothetical protein
MGNRSFLRFLIEGRKPLKPESFSPAVIGAIMGTSFAFFYVEGQMFWYVLLFFWIPAAYAVLKFYAQKHDLEEQHQDEKR